MKLFTRSLLESVGGLQALCLMIAIKSNGNLISSDYICLINAHIKILLSKYPQQWPLLCLECPGSVINIDLNWLENCKGDKDQLMDGNEAGPM